VRYLEVSIRCRRLLADAVGHLLSELSGGGYAVADSLPILEARDANRWDATDLVPGDPEWVTVQAWLPETEALEQERYELEQGLARVRSLDLGSVDPPALRWVREEEWADAWKAYFRPFRVGRRLVVIPSWEQYDLKQDDLPLFLDPGMAFGTGTHATTRLCLAWLEELVVPGQRVLDVGTGSGILAIAAARLGAAAVAAVDLDPVAVEVAGENLGRNGVADRVAAIGGEIGDPAVRAWTAEGAPTLVVANIIAAVIRSILPAVAAMLPAGGIFLASGIIREKEAELTGALAAEGLQPVEVREEGGWVAILARKW
jgi:ribosomal protein L11 methyltransferase